MNDKTPVNITIYLPNWVYQPRFKMALAMIALGILLLVAVPTVMAISPQAIAPFNDVPPGHQFYDDIMAIGGAGITTSCGGGNYCPDDYVTRKAMAAFMHRGFGRTTWE